MGDFALKKKAKYEAPKSLNLSGVAQGACRTGSNYLTGNCTQGPNAGNVCNAGSTAGNNCNPGTYAAKNCNPGGNTGP